MAHKWLFFRANLLGEWPWVNIFKCEKAKRVAYVLGPYIGKKGSRIERDTF